MKVVFITICCIIFAAGTGLCDPIDDRLPDTLSPALKANARQMIGIGLKDDDAVDLIKAMLQHRFQVRQILQVQQIIIKSHRIGLPTHPITNKAYEGMSKRVAAGRIVAALEQVHTRYAFAYEQIAKITQQKAPTVELGNLLAGSLTAGIARDDARAIIGSLGSRGTSLSNTQSEHLARESLSAVRDVARLGVSSQTATAVIVQALDKGLTASDIAAIHTSFIAQSRHTAPELLAQSYRQAIQSGKDAQSVGAKEGSQTGHQGNPASAGDAEGAAGGTGSGGGSGGGSGSGGSAGGR